MMLFYNVNGMKPVVENKVNDDNSRPKRKNKFLLETIVYIIKK